MHGCGPAVPTSGGASSESTVGVASTGVGSSTTVVTGDVEGTGMEGTGSTTDPTTSAADSSTGVAVTGTFIVGPDLPGVPCNSFTQDCPPGEKCMPYAEDGGGSWNALKCVPVMADPVQVGEVCVVVENGVSGIDNCDVGLMCWDADQEGQGYCVALCKGTVEAPICEDPTKTCNVYSEGIPALCLNQCDPLLQDCDPNDVCVVIPDKQGFGCALDASGDEGQQHDPCVFANECDSGLHCAEVTAAAECDQNAQGCCEPFCDVTEPDADANCGGVGQVCTPLFGDDRPPPDNPNVGYCAVPE